MKTITLNSNGLGRYDDVSPFVLTDGKLELEIIVPKRNGLFYFVGENNDVKFQVLIPASGSLILDGLTPGELIGEVKHYLKGELIESYNVETLLLRKLDGSCTADPAIAKLTSEVQIIKGKNAVLAKVLNEEIESLTKQLNALRQFAKDCISAIPYISDLKIKEDE